MVRVLDDLEIPEAELAFTTSRSSGPGGQNVNKVSTRVTLLWNVEESASVSAEQRELLRRRLSSRIGRQGTLRVTSQRHRTQLANREAAVRRFAELLREVLTEASERIPVEVPAQLNERRLEEKRRRSRLKRERVVDLSAEE